MWSQYKRIHQLAFNVVYPKLALDLKQRILPCIHSCIGGKKFEEKHHY
jgi:hypothetical protein